MLFVVRCWMLDIGYWSMIDGAIKMRAVMDIRMLVVLAVFATLILVSCASEPETIIIDTPSVTVTPIITRRRQDESHLRAKHPQLPTPTPAPTPTPPQTPDTTAPIVATVTPLRKKINLNTASAEALASLPRIGPKIARRIIVYRETKGPFRRLEDVKNVEGIGDATYEAIKDLVAANDR